MSRPTKYDDETAKKLVDFIEQGLTVKDACLGVKISPDTCARWRQKYPDFNKEFLMASKRQQWGSASALAQYRYRGYRRKVRICPDYSTKPLQSLVEASQSPSDGGDASTIVSSAKPTYYRGFPIRYGRIDEDKPFTVCSSARYPERLEWCVRENGTIVLHTCLIDTYLRKILGRPSDDDFAPIVVI